MRQVVDESLNPLWNPPDGAKIIDLQADINTNINIPIVGIRFRLAFWSDGFNAVNDPNALPAPTGVTDWGQYTGADFMPIRSIDVRVRSRTFDDSACTVRSGSYCAAVPSAAESIEKAR